MRCRWEGKKGDKKIFFCFVFLYIIYKYLGGVVVN